MWSDCHFLRQSSGGHGWLLPPALSICRLRLLIVHWSWFARVNALCNLLHKKLREVTASLLSWFLSRRCFTMRITMEAEPRIAKQHKCHHCCSCKNYHGKGMEGGRKGLWVIFLADQKIVLGHPIARATGYCLLPDTFWLQASKNVC